MMSRSGPDRPGAPHPGRSARHVLAITGWIAGGVVAFAALAVLLLAALVNVDGVHRYLIALAQREASAKLGVPVTLENFKLDLPALRVDLYGLTFDGAAPFRTPPLLQVSHIEASLRIVSLIHFKWYLNRVEVDHPVAWIIEGEHGESNLPVPQGSGGKSNVNLFSLAIRHARLDHGEIYFNDHPHNLDASLIDLDLSAAYNNLARSYNGKIAYADGKIAAGAWRPMQHSFEADFSLTSETLLLHQALLRIGNSTLAVKGTVQNFSQPAIHAEYDARIDGGELGRIMRRPWTLSGAIEARGTMAYLRDPAKPAIDSLTISGNAASQALWLKTRGHAVPVRTITADYALLRGVVTLREFRASLLGGLVTAKGMEKPSGSHSGGKMEAEVRGISLAQAKAILLTGAESQLGVSGTLNGTAAGSWGPRLNHLVAKVDATTAGQLIRQAENSGTGAQPGAMAAFAANVPLSAEIHGTYTSASGRIELRNTSFHTPGTSLILNGAAGKTSSLSVHFETRDVAEVMPLAALFESPQSAASLRTLDLSGQASFQGSLSGEVTAPQLTGYLDATHVSINGSIWKSVHTSISLSPSFLRLENAYLAPSTQGSIRFSANAALKHWSLSKASSIEAALSVSQMRVTDLLRVAKLNAPVNGIVTAGIHVHGSINRPDGSGSIELTKATAYKQPIKAATARFSAAGGAISGDFSAQIAGGRIVAHGNINPLQRTYSGTIHSTGVELANLESLQAGDAKVEGGLMLNASGSGSFDNPEMNGDIRVMNLSIEGHVLSTMDLHVNFANRVATADISSKLAESPLKAHGTVALSGNYPVNLSLDTQTVSLQPLLALYAPDIAEQVTGQTQIHLELHGPLKQRQDLIGQLTIPVLRVTYNNMASLAAQGPIHIDYQGGMLRVQPVAIHGTDTELQLQGEIPVYSHAPFALQVSGDVNLQIVQLIDPDLRSAGTARINIHAGNALNGGLAGQIVIAGASLSSASVPVGLQDGNGVLTLDGNRIDIASFNGNVGGGTVTAKGGVALRPKLGFDLGMTATNVRMLYPQGMRETLNANLTFTGSTERALLGGSVGISDISFTPAFDLTSMIGQFSTGVTAPTAPGFSQNLFLNVAVHSTNTLAPASKTMSVAGTAALTVRGTAANPALVGRVNLSGGSMIFNGDRFVLTGGTIQFVNPNQIRPVLNVSLTTTIQQYNIDLRIIGPAEQMRTEFTSNPSLPQADIIHLLAFGTTTEAQATGNPLESGIASGVSSKVTSRISKIAGISQLSISPVLTSGTAAGPPGAVITIRQQVTGNLFITFSTNVASTQDETIQGEYRLSPRVSVSATRDPNGGFAVDTLIRKSW